MNNPNLQQIPARDPELGPLIRSLFLPEEDEQWAAIDFSQQEPRILVHYAHVYGKSRNLELNGVSEFVDGYRENPDMDFHTMVAEMAGIGRKQAKVIKFGMMYGMGVNKLSEQLDIPVDEAKTIIRQYHSRVPFVKGLMTGVQNRLNDQSSSGSIRSILGRKCRFDLWEPDTFGMNKALPYREAVQEYGETTRLKAGLHLQGIEPAYPSVCRGYDQTGNGKHLQVWQNPDDPNPRRNGNVCKKPSRG